MKRANMNIFHIFSCFAIVVMFAIVGYFIYLAFFQGGTPITYYNIPFPTHKQVYTPGEKVSLYINMEKTHDSVAELTLTLVDGISYTTGAQTQRVCAAPCAKEYWARNVVEIPEFAEPGIYHIEGLTRYKINALRTVSVPFESQKFEVRAKQELELTTCINR